MTTTTFRDEIRATVSPWKFGGSRMAAMLYLLDLDGGADDFAANGQGDYAARFGRHILTADDMGFVAADRFATVDEAVATFETIRGELEGEGDDDDA